MSGPYAPTDLTKSAPPPAPLASISEAGEWSVPEGLAAEAAKQPETPPVVDLDKSTITDQVQQDAAPLAWPAGAPKMRPLLRLPRAQRADFLDQLDPLWEKVQALPKRGDSVAPKQAAEMYRTLSEVEKFLRPLAEDSTAYDEWLAGPGSEDAVFMGLFNAFIGGTQVGEADSSSS